ncbi:MAG: serine hydrolase domain-containing protein [Dokdonella sp.]
MAMAYRRVVRLLVLSLAVTHAAIAADLDHTSSTTDDLATALVHAQTAPVSDGSADAQRIAKIASDAMSSYHLRSVEVAVAHNGKVVYSGALGESMSGERATTNMHFRNGSFAFTYIATLALVMVDRQRLDLEDRVSKYLPDIPHSAEITVRQLLNMTSGYTDYVYATPVLDMYSSDPFHQWTTDELIEIGASPPLQFAPGSNWGYSHTNYMILGKLLPKVTRMPLAASLMKYVLKPMRLEHTQGARTAAIPDPVMHTFSSERRGALGILPEIPFYEETTFWSPSWTLPAGATLSTTIADLVTTMDAVARGTILSNASHHAQTDDRLSGFGHKDPACPQCFQNTHEHNYGLGLINQKQWVTQTMFFSGHGASAGAIASRRLSIAVSITYAPQAFDATGEYRNASDDIFRTLADALAPGTGPAAPGSVGAGHKNGQGYSPL